MTDRDALYWSSPASVRIGVHGGGEALMMFATRLEAEQFVYMLPLMQQLGDENAAAVTWAMLAESGVGLN